MRKLLLLIVLVLSALHSDAQKNDDILAAQFYQSGDFEKAVVIYERLFNSTKNVAYYDPLFTCLLNLKRYEEAEKVVRQQLKSSRQNYIYSVDLGRILQQRGQKEQAEAWFTKLVSSLPKDEAAIRELATAFYRADAYEHSVKTYQTGRKVLGDEKAF